MAYLLVLQGPGRDSAGNKARPFWSTEGRRSSLIKREDKVELRSTVSLRSTN